MTFKVHASFHETKILSKKAQFNLRRPKRSLHFISDWSKHEDNNLMFGIKKSLAKHDCTKLEITLKGHSNEYLDKINHQLEKNIETLIYMKGQNSLHLCKINSIESIGDDQFILVLDDLYLQDVDFKSNHNVKANNVFEELKWSDLKRQCTKPYIQAQEFLQIGVYKHHWESMSLYTKHYLTQAYLFKNQSLSKGVEADFKSIKSKYFHYQSAVISELNDIFINPIKSYLEGVELSSLGIDAQEALSKQLVITSQIDSISGFQSYIESAPFECYRILKLLDKSLSEQSLILQQVIKELDCQISLLMKEGITKKLSLFDRLVSQINSAESITRNKCIELNSFLDEFMSTNTQVNLIFFFQEFKGESKVAIKDTFEQIELLVA